ncbi:hypothetical protein FSP39_002571 [Pinctada imbricata]|uniref:SH2 domain-containing protein 3C n=1 Tax=Pinctada imbricata TaxID=66713 RepID=A0AA88XT83_PINIB|nr:hypothetical protein FSP39_002571 [Pinctada imbricata]
MGHGFVSGMSERGSGDAMQGIDCTGTLVTDRISMLDCISADLHRIVLQKQQVMAHKHIPIETWLEALGLKEYLPNFSGTSGVEELLNLTETEVKDLGVKNGAHRAKIVSSLRILKEKYERGYKMPHVLHRSHSASAQLCSNTPNSYPDYQVINVSPERLEHDLISELKSDPSELKHWPWYHGSISRPHAENLVSRTGDFLVRDCISQPGDFVLTCAHRGVPLHFLINTEVTEREKGGPPDITYSVEDDKFCSIQDLVQFHLAHLKQVTKTSGAVISNPIARTMPLSYYDVKYGYAGGMGTKGHYSTGPSPVGSPKGSPAGSPKSHRKPIRAGSQPQLISSDKNSRQEVRTNLPFSERCDSLPSVHAPGSDNVTTGGFHRYHQRAGSEPVVVPELTTQGDNSNYLMLPKKLAPSTSDSYLNKPPPPKPSRIPSVKYIGKERPTLQIRNKEIYDEDDRDYSDYSQVKEAPSWLSQNHSPNHHNQASQESPYNHYKQVNQLPKIEVNISPYSSNNVNDDYDNNFGNVNDVRENDDNTPPFPVSKKTSDEEDTPPFPVNGEILRKTRKHSDTRFSILDSRDYSEVPPTPVTPKGQQLDVLIENATDTKESEYEVHLRHRKLLVPNIETDISFNPTDFTTSLLPEENKPLEPTALLKVKETILSSCVRKLGHHFTQCDIEVCKVVNDLDLGLGVTSGLELITLPHGKQLRQDVIERCYCTKTFVMVTVLTCGKVTERAQMLSQWIQIASELRSSLGNLFGFANVMEGLTASQVLRLRDTWLLLRQNHTNSAFIFDTKLKAAYKSLNDGSGLLPLQNVSIPDVAPVVFLMERDIDSIMTHLPWELSDQNCGLDILLTHLDTARLITAQSGLYRVNAQNVLKENEIDGQVTDIFRTEFHMRLLWGYKGAVVNRIDRQGKFEQLLTALSNRAEAPGDDGTAV